MRAPYSAGVTYALKVLAEAVGLPSEVAGTVLHYGIDHAKPEGGCGAVHIVPSALFTGHVYGTPGSLPAPPLPQIEGIPLLYGTPEVERRGNQLIVHADIVASTYLLVTRYEEMVRRDVRDEHGRFPGKESLPYRAGFLHRPVVEEYAALLRKWLREVGVDVPEPKREFSLLLTHDVDLLAKYRNPLRTAASALLGRQPLRNVAESVSTLLGLRRDPYDNLDDMIALDRCASAPTKSVYFVMGGGSSRYDGAYDVHSSQASNMMRQVLESGAEIGLHASYQAGLEPERIAAEKAALEEAAGTDITGGRHHYLAWREIEDGWHLVQAGIKWDATLGYADVAGFRLGVCHPIPLFDPVRMAPMGITEHPLIVMDCTLDRHDYMSLDTNAAHSCCLSLLHETRKHRGELVLLWHNTSFEWRPGNYLFDLYLNLLSEYRVL